MNACAHSTTKKKEKKKRKKEKKKKILQFGGSTQNILGSLNSGRFVSFWKVLNSFKNHDKIDLKKF